ncbi:MAG: FAD:protein FMN transferase [Planctomycetota bacterium]
MILLGALAGCSAPPPLLARFEFAEPKLGTQFRIVLWAPSAALAEQAAVLAFARIDQLNASLSDYDPESEVSMLACGAPVHGSDDLLAVLEPALVIAEQSEGAFDVTVGPLVELWREAARTHVLPAASRIAAARACVGWQWLRVDARQHTVQLAHPRMRIDLGGIAKGYAADAAMQALERAGITRALVAGGGDIVAGAAPPGRAGWVVALDPLAGAPPARVELEHAAVSTSGDTYQFVAIGGVRYSHIVDPRTGMGVTHRTAASVIARNGTTADALATAVCVLGAERGIALVSLHAGAWARVVTAADPAPLVCESRPLPDHEEFVNLGRCRYRRLLH